MLGGLGRILQPQLMGPAQQMVRGPFGQQGHGAPSGSGTPGQIMQGPDGQNYQYAQTSGMAADDGSGWGWIRTSMSPQGGGAGGLGGMFGNALARFQDVAQNNPEALMALGSGMMQGNMGAGFASAGEQMTKNRERQMELQQKNQTVDWLMRNKRMSRPDAVAVAANPILLKDALTSGEGAPAAFQTLQMRAQAAGLQPGSPEYQQFMAQGGRSPDESAANQRIERMTENLMATGDFVDPQQAQNIAVGIVDGRLKADRHPVTGELQVVDMATGRVVYGRGAQQPQPSTLEAPSQPMTQNDQFGRQFPASQESFGVGGAAQGAINTLGDITGVGAPYPEVQQTQADFDVLRESLLNDIAGAYNRQPPSWLMQEIRNLTPQAGSVFQGAGGAQSKLRSLGRHMENELRVTRQSLQRELSPQNRQELEARAAGLEAGLARVSGALESFGGEPTIPQEAPGGEINEGATATNPQTGERVIFRNGRWEPLQ